VPARILEVDQLPVAATRTTSPPAGTLANPSFVPDFSGHTVARALRLARRESLVLSIRGARNGRVVSQIPVPGTLLDGDDRTVRLQLVATREEG
jgi:hypothetical protein